MFTKMLRILVVPAVLAQCTVALTEETAANQGTATTVPTADPEVAKLIRDVNSFDIHDSLCAMQDLKAMKTRAKPALDAIASNLKHALPKGVEHPYQVAESREGKSRSKIASIALSFLWGHMPEAVEQAVRNVKGSKGQALGRIAKMKQKLRTEQKTVSRLLEQAEKEGRGAGLYDEVRSLGKFTAMDKRAGAKLVEILKEHHDKSSPPHDDNVARKTIWCIGIRPFLIDQEELDTAKKLILADAKDTGNNLPTRKEAVVALGRLKAEQAAPDLLEMLKSDGEGIDELILGARAPDYLIAEGTLRVGLVWALGRMECQRAVDELIENLGHENPMVVRWAAWALGRMGSEEAVPELIKLLEYEYQTPSYADKLGRKPDPKERTAQVRQAAEFALRKITGRDLGKDPSAWAEAASAQK
jgi:hypothetical protein